MVLWLGLRCELFRGFALLFFSLRFFFITFSMHEFYCSFRNTSERNIFYIYANFVDWLLCMCYTHTHRTAEYLKRLSLSLALRSLSYSPFATLSHPPSCSHLPCISAFSAKRDGNHSFNGRNSYGHQFEKEGKKHRSGRNEIQNKEPNTLYTGRI